ncbi:MAG TPA: hypothetical protein DIT25_00810 [Candidatus Moranbacteria bacterium]|nr:hypothetical protein [Candidatus Moranbacteria bacterium]
MKDVKYVQASLKEADARENFLKTIQERAARELGVTLKKRTAMEGMVPGLSISLGEGQAKIQRGLLREEKWKHLLLISVGFFESKEGKILFCQVLDRRIKKMAKQELGKLEKETGVEIILVG